jgi:hypothetical protein
MERKTAKYRLVHSKKTQETRERKGDVIELRGGGSSA